MHIRHRAGHARKPLVPLGLADGERKMPRTQSRMTEATDEVVRSTGPSTQEPEQLVARACKRGRMKIADDAIRRVGVHAVVESIHEPAYSCFALERLENGWAGHVANIRLRTAGCPPGGRVPDKWGGPLGLLGNSRRQPPGATSRTSRMPASHAAIQLRWRMTSADGRLLPLCRRAPRAGVNRRDTDRPTWNLRLRSARTAPIR